MKYKSKKLSHHETFIDLQRCKKKEEAARPYIELMLAMGKLEGNVRFGGPQLAYSIEKLESEGQL